MAGAELIYPRAARPTDQHEDAGEEAKAVRLSSPSPAMRVRQVIRNPTPLARSRVTTAGMRPRRERGAFPKHRHGPPPQRMSHSRYRCARSPITGNQLVAAVGSMTVM